MLPIGTRPVEDPDEQTGWRGAPERPQLLMKVVVTTLVAAVVWFGAWLLITSHYVSFRHGWFARRPTATDDAGIAITTVREEAPPSDLPCDGVSSPNLAPRRSAAGRRLVNGS